MAMNLPVWAKPVDVGDLLRLSIPIAITRMSMMLMHMTDAILLGQFAPGELAYVLSAWLPMGISMGLGLGILLGVQVLTSELSGQGREAESGRIFRRGLVWAIALGAFLSLVLIPGAKPFFHWLFVTVAPPSEGDVPAEVIARETAVVTRIFALALVFHMISQACSYYLEALRRPLMVTAVMYGGAVVNLLIGLHLVGGFWGGERMGAEGVAWATTISRVIITVLLLALVIAITPGFKRLGAAETNEAARQFSVGTGTAISNVAEWGGFNMTFVIATWISLAASSVYGYATQLMGLCFMFYLGIASATSVRVAEAVGRQDREGVRNAGRLGVVATIVMGAILGLIVVVFREPISLLLIKGDAELGGIPLAPAIASLLIFAGMITVFDGLQATASFALRAQGMVWLPSAIHLGSFFVVMLPLCFWFGITMGRGPQGVMEGACVALILAGSLQVALLEWKAARPLSGRAASVVH
jgi:multidrug resistance protein, MATE family